MDAQNAVEPSTTKQPASPRRGDKDRERDRTDLHESKSNPNASLRSPVIPKSSSVSRQAKSVNASSNAHDDDPLPDQNSDAETIVLPGKDGISPSKPRKVIKHEDKSDGELDDSLPPPRRPHKDGKDGDRNGAHGEDPVYGASSSLLRKKKRLPEKEKQQRNKDGSSGLSSAPASPPVHRISRDPVHSRRRSGDAHSESGSESSKPRPRRMSLKDKTKSVDRHLSKRKAIKTESDDEGESRKIRRSRVSDTIDTSISTRDRDHKSSLVRRPDKQLGARNRSTSPPGRPHRRSLSTQLPSQFSNGFNTKKRRPAPLHTTDYHSDDSSASGSPHPRSSKLRSLATPVTGDSTVSPARMPGHRKHVDNHGQTLFAKACAKGEYDLAKKRLAERPEDLNFADYAGNTPLQVASLNGHENIVELLIEAGCNIECRNTDKETPLLDAVENGHLEVVKILLKAGVNPRKADAEGHEPLEKVPDDLDNAEEIRAALRDAKERVGELRRTSEDHHPQDLQDALSSHEADSPRRSPAALSGASLAAQRRGGTVRSTKTSNHLLYMNLDDKTLRVAAARGDHETVTRVLQVKERCDDPEVLVNAARGGHNLVAELLLALGSANPDPRPAPGLPVEYGTPMLAAIGQENIEVIKLLLNASGFDPTRRYKGQTYYEIARKREGPNWKDEETLLKNAYDDFKKSAPKGSSKAKSSPSRRERDTDPEGKRAPRSELRSDAAKHKRRPSSPTGDSESKKKLNSSATKVSSSPREKRRSLSFGHQDDQHSPKRGPGRPKKEERGTHGASSDRETSPARSKVSSRPKVMEQELAAAGSSDGEAFKPRRKLISGKDLKGQREKQRRASMASSNSADRVDGKNDEVSEKNRVERLSERYHDRTKALKRDDSMDRLSTGDNIGKRHRSSVSPSRHGTGDKEESEVPIKRRKLEVEGKERRHLQPSSPDNRQTKREPSRESAKRRRSPDNERKESLKAKKTNRDRKETDKPLLEDKQSIIVASDEADIEMRDAPPVAPEEVEVKIKAERERQEAEKRQAEAEAVAAADEAKRESERLRQEEKRQQEAEAAKRKEEEAEKKRQVEEAEKARLEREREEAKRKEEELKRKEEEQARLAAERRLRDEQERKRREEDERKQREEEELKKKQEEERLRREKEAAEARRLREEEERKERERKQAEQAAREAEIQRARQEEERRIRLSRLPPLLRWLDSCPDPKQREIAEVFSKAQGVRYDTIDPSATGKPGGREQWLLNTQVALLLGEKDLSLSRYTTWERIPVSKIAKTVVWRLENDRYSLTESKLYGLGKQLPDYYGGDPRTVGYRKLEQLRGEAAKLFFESDMFFVKESDFLYIVPTIPHLRNVKLSICYCELPEHESALMTWSTAAKWKLDPDAADHGTTAPRNKYYINGQMVGEDKPRQYTPSKVPFPESRVPRRGLVAVTPDEPDYVRLCVEQDLAHLLTEQQKQAVLGGPHLTPRSMGSDDPVDYASEALSPTSVSPHPTLVNGVKSPHHSPDRLPNGINGSDSNGEH